MVEKKVIVFLKDVSKDEVKHVVKDKFSTSDIHYINYTDFYGSLKNRIKILKEIRGDCFSIVTYDLGYLKWSYIFVLLTLLTKVKKRYIIDLKGNSEKINFIYLLRETVRTFFSAVLQLLSILLVPIYSFISNKKKYYKLGDLSDKNVAYMRTTDTFNLTSGGSLGHTLGIIQGLKIYVKSVGFYGIDNIKDLRSLEKYILPPKKTLNNIVVFNRFLYSLYFSRKVKKQMIAQNINVIYQRISRDNLSGVLLSKRMKIPLIVEFNSFLEWELKGNQMFFGGLFLYITNLIEKINLKNAELIVVVSDVLKEELIKKGYDSSRIQVVYNGVNLNKFQPIKTDLKNRLNIPKSNIIYGFCGTFGGWHGIDVLSLTIEKTIKDNPNITFLLIGDGLLRSELENKFKNDSEVIFTGKVPYSSVVEYLSICDVLLSPHNTKEGEKFIGSPTKLFEYMGMEKIIIASRLDQISEVVSPSITANCFQKEIEVENEVGITVKKGDIEELYQAIVFSYENQDKLKKLGVNARKKALKEYTWETTTRKILKKIENEQI